MSGERDVVPVEGIAVWERTDEDGHGYSLLGNGEPTHRMFAAPVAEALIDVARAARIVGTDRCDCELCMSLDRLDAARTTTPRRDETRGET